MRYLLLFAPFVLFAQPQAHVYVTAAPSGACTARAVPQIRLSTGAIYTCAGGTWSVTGTVSPTGTVTNVTGTANEATITNPTTTPNVHVIGVNNVQITGVPTSGQAPVATGATTASWQTVSATGALPNGSPGVVQTYATSTTLGGDTTFVHGPTLAAPSAPAVTPTNPGATTAQYAVCLIDLVGLRCGASTTIMNSNATLNMTNFNTITLPTVFGINCAIYRYGGGVGVTYGAGLLFTGATTVTHACDGTSMTDNGQLGSGLVRARDTSLPIDTSDNIGAFTLTRGGNNFSITDFQTLGWSTSDTRFDFKNYLWTDGSGADGEFTLAAQFNPTANLNVATRLRNEQLLVTGVAGMDGVIQNRHKFSINAGSPAITDSLGDADCAVAVAVFCNSMVVDSTGTLVGNIATNFNRLAMAAVTVTGNGSAVEGYAVTEAAPTYTGIYAGLFGHAGSVASSAYTAGVFGRAEAITVTSGAFQMMSGQTAPVLAALDTSYANLFAVLPSGLTDVKGIASIGTKFTTSGAGCTVTATTGGATAGTFTTSTTGTCVTTITMNGATGLTAPNGWSCDAKNITAGHLVVFNQTATSATTCTISGVTVSGDVIVFDAIGY